MVKKMDRKEIKRKFTSLLKLMRDNKKYKFRRFLEKSYITTLQFLFSLLPKNGVKIIEEEWDYLILLDACRYDTFKKYNKIDGKLNKKISLGSGTREWLKSNFKKYNEDIVYVSANPFASNYDVAGFKASDYFYHVEDVWKYGWDKKTGTVPAENVTRAAIKIRGKYPQKKMVIHYMQPHGPWLGKTRLTAEDINEDLGGGRTDNFLPVTAYFWDEAKYGDLNIETIKKAYEDNLVYVLSEVKKLIKHLNGKIVITADHGTAFGKWGIYFHPRFIRMKDLNEIPWFVIEKNEGKIERKKKKDERGNKKTEGDERKIKERLASLGYT